MSFADGTILASSAAGGAVFHGVTRDQMVGRHAANHVQVVYANSTAEAEDCLKCRAAMAQSLGIEVTLCGVTAKPH